MPEIKKPAKILVPLKNYDCNYKIVYVDNTNTEITIGDLTQNDYNKFLSGTFTRRSLRYGLGDFNINLSNEAGFYNTILLNATKIRAYADHIPTSSSVTNQIFEGRIGSTKFSLDANGFRTINIYGREWPQLADRHITVSFDGSTYNAAIQYIIDNFFNGVFTYTNIVVDNSTAIYGQYINQTVLSIISDILKQANKDGFIDFTGDIHIFSEGGQINSIERIAYNDNMLSYSEIGKDFLDEKNSVTVYGATTDGVLLLRTKNNTTLQSTTWIKTEIQTDNNLTTINTTNQKAQVELDFLSQTPQIGFFTAANGLPTLLPAQSIPCEDQYGQVTGNYNIVLFTHNLDSTGWWSTDCNINRLDKTERVSIRETSNETKAITTQNINGMTQTVFLLTFDDSAGLTLGNATISGGALTITSGSQTTCTTSTSILDSNPTSFEARAKGAELNISYYQVSNDGGITGLNTTDTQYSLINDLDKIFTFSASNKNIQIKIVLNSDATFITPRLESFTFLVK